MHIRYMVKDGVYRRGAGGPPEFVEVTALNDDALQSVLHRSITRMMTLLTRPGVLAATSADHGVTMIGW